jgi:hypothetical protein
VFREEGEAADKSDARIFFTRYRLVKFRFCITYSMTRAMTMNLAAKTAVTRNGDKS